VDPTPERPVDSPKLIADLGNIEVVKDTPLTEHLLERRKAYVAIDYRRKWTLRRLRRFFRRGINPNDRRVVD
jgi:hypothetical protein